jgi:hypothetical protein
MGLFNAGGNLVDPDPGTSADSRVRETIDFHLEPLEAISLKLADFRKEQIRKQARMPVVERRFIRTGVVC